MMASSPRSLRGATSASRWETLLMLVGWLLSWDASLYLGVTYLLIRKLEREGIYLKL
jgi:hypothetical protein